MDILDRLRDLHKQATTERSHYYVASCCAGAIAEIEMLRTLWKDAVDDKHAWAAREVRAEREVCAQIVYDYGEVTLAEAIRNRK